MRILVGYDGSPAAETARALVASWPLGDETLVRLVTAVEPAPQLFGLPYVPGLPDGWQAAEAQAVAQQQAVLDAAAAELAAAARARTDSGAGRVRPPETKILRDRPSTALVDEAVAWQADLLVVGSRGRSAAESGVMGSVATEVIDQASVPVLVARRETSRKVLIAHDGSPHADRAVELVARWPIFAPSDLRVLSVVHPSPLRHLGLPQGAEAADAAMPPTPAATGARRPRRSRRVPSSDPEEAQLDLHREIADRACQRLLELGRFAEPRVRRGRATTEIVETANAWADLVVVGSRGRTGLARLILGSVARGVLLQAGTSVLVVR
jgi:nucleotide-binding universal stress UspA family protein